MRSFLTQRCFALFSLWVLLAVVGLVSEFAFLLALVSGTAFVVVLLRDYSSLPLARHFEAKVSFPSSPELDMEVEFENLLLPKVSIASQSLWLLPLARNENFRFKHQKESFALKDGALQATQVGRAIRLGYGVVKHMQLSALSRFGLWNRHLDVAVEPQEYRVSPSLQKVPEEVFSEVIATQRLLFQGSRLLTKGNTVDQFHSLRKFQFTDSLRHIDPKKTARYGQLMTRVYDSYHNHHLYLVLDLGRALVGTMRKSAKEDFYISACLSLAQTALQSQDSVSLLAFGQRIRYQVRQARHMRSFSPLFRGDSVLQAKDEHTDFGCLSRLVPQTAGQRSIVVVLSDFSRPYVQESVIEHLGALSHKHVVLCLSLVEKDSYIASLVDQLESADFTEEEMVKHLYAYWLDEQLALFAKASNQYGAACVAVSEEYWLSVAQRVYQTLRQSLRL